MLFFAGTRLFFALRAHRLSEVERIVRLAPHAARQALGMRRLTALMLAAEQRDETSVRLLAPLSLPAVDSHGRTPLMFALAPSSHSPSSGAPLSLDVLLLLADKSPLRSQESPGGRTALMFAVMAGQAPLVRALLARAHSLSSNTLESAHTTGGQSVYQLAAQFRQLECLRALFEHWDAAALSDAQRQLASEALRTLLRESGFPAGLDFEPNGQVDERFWCMLALLCMFAEPPLAAKILQQTQSFGSLRLALIEKETLRLILNRKGTQINGAQHPSLGISPPSEGSIPPCAFEGTSLGTSHARRL